MTLDTRALKGDSHESHLEDLAHPPHAEDLAHLEPGATLVVVVYLDDVAPWVGTVVVVVVRGASPRMRPPRIAQEPFFLLAGPQRSCVGRKWLIFRPVYLQIDF